MTKEVLISFITWAMKAHEETNQKYDGLPFHLSHLRFVVAQYRKFKGLLHPADREYAYAACYGHDLIEDARITYNELVQQIGTRVSDIIYACTEEKGKNREERHSDKFYKELAEDEVAVFVKLCDILANVTYSVLTNSKMLRKRKEEHEKIKFYLYIPRYKLMFDQLETLLNLPEIKDEAL